MSSLITLQHIEKTFPTTPHVPALQGVSFSLQEKEQCVLVGQSGSGKSTLLSILGLLDTPTKGIYEFEGENILLKTHDEQANIRKKNFAFIFQHYALLNHYTVLQNVMLPFQYRDISPTLAKQMAIEALAAVGLFAKRSFYPTMLSGGQRQRVAIARALVIAPKVILADEPTAALDPKNRQIILDLLKNLAEKHHAALMIVTHDESIASQFERRLELAQGKMVSS